jgi:DNA-binding beta-propeller fold protein YncE
VPSYFDNTVTIIDGATNTTSTLKTITSGLDAVAIDSVTNKVYVVGSNLMIAIDGSSGAMTTSRTGAGPIAVAVNPVTNKVYVANRDSNNVTVTNGARVTTSTSLTSSPNPSHLGQAVTFTAQVSSTGPVPTGRVKFLDGTTGIGAPKLSGGVAKLTKSTLAVGTHQITAQYLGDVNSAKSTSAVLDQVVQ